MTHLYETILYISSVDDILLKIKAADGLINNNHKVAYFHEMYLYENAKDLLNKFCLRHLMQNKEKLQNFALLHEKWIK